MLTPNTSRVSVLRTKMLFSVASPHSYVNDKTSAAKNITKYNVLVGAGGFPHHTGIILLDREACEACGII
jgi:hypothetical protein